jgi:hypothetical protein
MDPVKQKNSLNDVLYCPHHPRSVVWYWRKSCDICKIISLSLDGEITPVEVQVSRVETNGHPDYRHARWPHVCIYSRSTETLSPQSCSGAPLSRHRSLSKRERRREKAGLKYPYTFPRKGSDTNLFSLTGKVLSIQREGLASLGRTVTGIKTCNSSGFPWKSI